MWKVNCGCDDLAVAQPQEKALKGTRDFNSYEFRITSKPQSYLVYQLIYWDISRARTDLDTDFGSL